MKHVYHKCGPECDGCQLCLGDLKLCDVCGGFEGELLPECPGRLLSSDEHSNNYHGNLAMWKRFGKLPDITRENE